MHCSLPSFLRSMQAAMVGGDNNVEKKETWRPAMQTARGDIQKRGEGVPPVHSPHCSLALLYMYIYISCVRTETSHLKMGEKLDHLGQEPSIQLVAAIEQRCCCFPLQPMHLCLLPSRPKLLLSSTNISLLIPTRPASKPQQRKCVNNTYS
jgi:hypothetical protein